MFVRLKAGLAALLFLCLGSGLTWADEEDDLEGEFDLLEEEEQIFSASRHSQPISDSPSTITVITREQIENSHCLDLTCILRQVPELDVRQVRPMFHSVGARTFTDELGDKGVVLIDGWEVNLESFGIPFWGFLAIHLDDVERIEVIRGPGSALYGANAHSMVVSITTRRSSEDSAEVFVAGGEHGYAGLNLRLSKLLGPWTMELTGGLESADHYSDRGRDEKDGQRVRLRIIRDWGGDSRSLVQAGMSAAEGHIFTQLAPVFLEDSYFANLMLAHEESWIRGHVWTSLFHSKLHFDLPLVMNGITLGQFPEEIQVLSSTVDGNLQANFSFWADSLWLVGANYRWLTYMSEDNVEDEVHQHRVGLYLQFEQRLFKQLLLNLGARVDYNNITPLTLSPRAALVWRFTDNQVIRLAGGRSFRKPSFFNTHFRLDSVEGSGVLPNLDEFFAESIGNPKLKNETLNAAELGYRGKFLEGTVIVEADAYFHLVQNPVGFSIDMAQSPLGLNLSDSSANFRNFAADVSTLGGSLALSYKPLPSMRLSANYSYRYSWYLHGMPENRIQPGREGENRFRWEPSHLANLAAYWAPEFGLRVGLALNVRSGYTQIALEDGSLFGDTIFIAVKPVAILSGHLGYRFQLKPYWLELGTRIWNVSNNPYRETVGETRFDGTEIGGHPLVRQVSLYLRGGF